MAINALLAQVHYLLRSSFDCSLLLPFLVSPDRLVPVFLLSRD
jgi:hypothetical protein